MVKNDRGKEDEVKMQDVFGGKLARDHAVKKKGQSKGEHIIFPCG